MAEEGFYDEAYDEAYYDEGYYDEGYDEAYNEPVQEAHVPQRPDRPAPPPRRSKPEQGYPFIALYDYTGANNDELTFRVGDELMVISQVKEGWYNASFNGRTGYAPSNYLQIKENQDEAAAAKKARRQKMMAERNELRATVEQKRALRKQLEEEVRELQDANRERKALIKKLANPTENPEFVLNDMTALAVQFFYVDKQQARFAELTTFLGMGMAGLRGQLNNDVKPGHPLEEQKQKYDEKFDVTKKAFSTCGEYLDNLIRSRKEFNPAFTQLRSNLSANLPH